jgi:glycosyltransferase involved in cell wall biosynthesis
MKGHIVMLLSNGFISDPRVEKEARALLGAGWRVTVVAWDRTQEASAHEDRDGIAVERLGPAASHGGGLGNVSAYRAFWRGAARRAVELQADVVHCHDLDTAPAGLSAVRRIGREAGRRIPLVLDFHELYRDSGMVPHGGAKGAVAGVGVRLVERAALRRADLVVIANPGTADSYGRAAEGKVVIVENAPDSSVFRPNPQAREGRPFTVGYTGQKRYIDALVQLMDVVQRHPDMHALLAGGGTAAAEVERIASRLERIEVSGRFSYAELPALYARFDVVHAVYDATLGNVRTLFPVKVMEGMACGLPVIVAKGTWAGDWVVEHGVGVAVDSSDSSELEDALVLLKGDPAMRAEMGVAGRRIVESGLDWATASNRLLAAYDRLERH